MSLNRPRSNYLNNQNEIPFADQYSYSQPVSGQAAQAMPYLNIASEAQREFSQMQQKGPQYQDMNMYGGDEPPMFQEQVNPYAKNQGVKFWAQDTAKGAAMGGQVAGPWGALVGGIIGSVTGTYKGVRHGQERRKWNRRQAQARDRFEQERTNYWQDRSQRDMMLAQEGFRRRQFNF